ncbi:recombinase RecA [Rhodococcus wratislaviensis]|uniref:recombinase RecA n=1 Tax=Rhodococcus wratislaviensis TaxID=44752 RepID=UPI001C3F9DED|nr:recombinase RecA [Rhodococcus wratislaviensis]
MESLKPVVLKRNDGCRLFYAGQVNNVFGDPESGKTWVCLAAVVEALHAGLRSLIIDLDHNGAVATIARLVALGAPEVALRDQTRFRYIEPEDHLELLEVVGDMGIWEPTVAVVDSIGELLPLFGFNSNSADDFTSVHTRVLKPLARSGACVLAVDHLAKGQDSRTQGPGGTAAKRRAIGGVSMRVKVKEPFTPGKGGSAYLSVNKDRHGGLRQHCPTGDPEPSAGLFVLYAFTDGILEWEVKAPDGTSAPADAVPSDDLAAIAALDPPPATVEDARQRLGWQKQRAGRALKAWREKGASVPGSRSGGTEPGTADE